MRRGRALLAMATAAAVLAASSGMAGAFPFSSAGDFGAGGDPASVATGDLDGDGNVDMVVANNDSNNVSVLLGNGDGTFAAQVPYGAGEDPASVATGHFDADGALDLAVANFGGGDVSVLLGNGDGTLDAPVHYTTGDGPIWVTVADVDEDSTSDLLVANENTGEVSVLIGNGDGTFAAADNYPAGFSSESIAVGDLDGDDNLDLAVASAVSSGVSILLGNGNGTFDTDVLYDAGVAPIAITADDLDGDTDLDLAVANGFGSTDVSVLLNSGTGTFPTHVEYASGTTPIAIVAADWDGDHDVDLAAANYGGTTDDVSVLLGNGDGTFAAKVTYAAGNGSSALAVDLVDDDPAPDIAVANQFTNNATVLLGTPPPAGDDTTAPVITITTPADGATHQLRASVPADFRCSDEAGGSGVDTCTGTVLDGAAIATGSVGTKSFTVNAEDNAGNTSSLSHSYKVGYRVLGGGFPSVFTKSTYRAGSKIAIKLRLGDAAGTKISDAEAQGLIAPTCRFRLVFDGSPRPGCATYDVRKDTFGFTLPLSSVLQDGQHTVAIQVTAPDDTIVNTDSATIFTR